MGVNSYACRSYRGKLVGRAGGFLLSILNRVKTTTNFIDSRLAYITNKNLHENDLSENAKATLMRPIHKENDRDKIVILKDL